MSVSELCMRHLQVGKIAEFGRAVINYLDTEVTSVGR